MTKQKITFIAHFDDTKIVNKTKGGGDGSLTFEYDAQQYGAVAQIPFLFKDKCMRVTVEEEV